MFKSIHDDVWAYDVEWVPDVDAGRVLYGLFEQGLTDEEVMSVMWERGGATAENPRPFLKTVVCRIVSIAFVRRKRTADGITLEVVSLPELEGGISDPDEGWMLRAFLHGLGRHAPQLVGYNSAGADLKILIQRAIVNGVVAEGLCRRSTGRSEGVDYLDPDSDRSIDLMRLLGGRGRCTPSLHEIATLSGIPGKLGVDGGDVAEMWLRGETRQIVAYNECDALTTYLLWLRVAHFAGKFTDAEYDEEQERVRELVGRKSCEPGGLHFQRYLQEWDRLCGLTRAGMNGRCVHAETRG